VRPLQRPPRLERRPRGAALWGLPIYGSRPWPQDVLGLFPQRPPANSVLLRAVHELLGFRRSNQALRRSRCPSPEGWGGRMTPGSWYMNREATHRVQAEKYEEEREWRECAAKTMEPCSAPFQWFIWGYTGGGGIWGVDRGPMVPTQCTGYQTLTGRSCSKTCVLSARLDARPLLTCSKAPVTTPLALDHLLYGEGFQESRYTANCRFNEGTSDDHLAHRLRKLEEELDTGVLLVRDVRKTKVEIDSLRRALEPKHIYASHPEALSGEGGTE
jgi:hypothetical protein